MSPNQFLGLCLGVTLIVISIYIILFLRWDKYDDKSVIKTTFEKTADEIAKFLPVIIIMICGIICLSETFKNGSLDLFLMLFGGQIVILAIAETLNIHTPENSEITDDAMI